MKTCLVIGSLNMDYTIYLDSFPLEGETVYGKNRFIQPGGKGENQAIALAKSNKVRTLMVGAIGKDQDGIAIKNVLKENGVIAHLKEFADIETGNAMIAVDKNSENKIVIIKGANGSLKKEDIDLNLIEESDYLIFENEIKQEVNEYCILEAKKRGKAVVYNPAPYREIDDKLYAYIDYFIVNEIELERYSGTSDLQEGISALLDKGVKNVLVTLGTKGSLFVSNDIKIKVDACKVKAVDTVAAGDTYVGYFVASLASGLSIEESMKIASKASSITVTRKGSVVSIPLGEEVY